MCRSRLRHGRGWESKKGCGGEEREVVPPPPLAKAGSDYVASNVS